MSAAALLTPHGKQMGGTTRAILVIVLDANRPLSTIEVAERSGLTTPTASNALKRLRDYGMIKRVGTVPSTNGGNKIYIWAPFDYQGAEAANDDVARESLIPTGDRLTTGGFVEEIKPGHRKYTLQNHRRIANDGIGNRRETGIGSGFSCQLSMPTHR